jgi:hypothetical protein
MFGELTVPSDVCRFYFNTILFSQLLTLENLIPQKKSSFKKNGKKYALYSTIIWGVQENKIQYLKKKKKTTTTDVRSCLSWWHAIEHKIFQELKTYYITRIKHNSENVTKLIQHNN